MKVETGIFAAGGVFFAVVGLAYGLVTGWQEAVGTTALFLTCGLSTMICAYLWVTSRRIDPRPEDDPGGEIAEGAGELGVFAPYSWWPLAVGVSSAVTFAGLAVGWWLVLIGVPMVMLSTIGWVFEFYRGEHVH